MSIGGLHRWETDLFPGLSRGPEEGALSIGGHRYLLIRPETLAPLCASTRRDVRKLLVAGGLAGGEAAAVSVLSQGWRGREAFERLLTFGASIGWGQFALIAWEDGRVVVALDDSAFAYAVGASGQPVCHTVCGVLSGMISTIRGAHYSGVETGCRAAGGGRCTFRLIPVDAGKA